MGVNAGIQLWSETFSPLFLVSLAAAFVYSDDQLATHLLPQNVKVAAANRLTMSLPDYLGTRIARNVTIWMAKQSQSKA